MSIQRLIYLFKHECSSSWLIDLMIQLPFDSCEMSGVDARNTMFIVVSFDL